MLTFKHPITSVNDRLDEIATMVRDWKPIEHEWPTLADIAWLRSVFAEFWSPSYPQPYIGTGPEDAMMSLYWKTVELTFTLEVDTIGKIGDLYRAPNQAIGEVELALDVDLTSRRTWAQIASELGVEVDRAANILAPSLGQSVSKRGNPDRRIPAQNQPRSSRVIDGRPRSYRRSHSKSYRTARYTRGATLRSRTSATRRINPLHRVRIGGGRRNAGVRARAA